MTNTDKEIIGTLLKSIFDKGLVSEAVYRSAQNRLRLEEKECSTNGYTKN